MQITVLGTGTSTGVPVLTCDCEVCTSTDQKDKRLRVSVYVCVGDTHIVIDTGPDFRQQALQASIPKLDAVLLTHEHKDHTAGLDDIRPYNYLQGPRYTQVFAIHRVMEQLKNEYYYAFGENMYPGVPRIETYTIEPNKTFYIHDVQVDALQVWHNELEILGYRIGQFAYITDAKTLPQQTLQKLQGLDVLIINALQKEPHVSHFTLDEAIEISKEIGAKKTYFTHMSHKMGLHKTIQDTLPEGIELAYDGLVISI
ncbi:MAG: MBL fold metallo-hydrolase [Leadbetterella sp.]